MRVLGMRTMGPRGKHYVCWWGVKNGDGTGQDNG